MPIEPMGSMRSLSRPQMPLLVGHHRGQEITDPVGMEHGSVPRLKRRSPPEDSEEQAAAFQQGRQHPPTVPLTEHPTSEEDREGEEHAVCGILSNVL
jgi:hypothetical protein